VRGQFCGQLFVDMRIRPHRRGQRHDGMGWAKTHLLL